MGGGVGNNDQWFSKKNFFQNSTIIFRDILFYRTMRNLQKKKKKSMKLMRVECEQDK